MGKTKKQTQVGFKKSLDILETKGHFGLNQTLFCLCLILLDCNFFIFIF